MKKIKVLFIESESKKPQVIEINDDLKEMQNLVNGFIECVYPFDDDTILVCNEEGKFTQSPNRNLGNDYIFGPFFLCSENGDSFGSLSDNKIKKYTQLFDL